MSSDIKHDVEVLQASWQEHRLSGDPSEAMRAFNRVMRTHNTAFSERQGVVAIHREDLSAVLGLASLFLLRGR